MLPEQRSIASSIIVPIRNRLLLSNSCCAEYEGINSTPRDPRHHWPWLRLARCCYSWTAYGKPRFIIFSGGERKLQNRILNVLETILCPTISLAELRMIGRKKIKVKHGTFDLGERVGNEKLKLARCIVVDGIFQMWKKSKMFR